VRGVRRGPEPIGGAPVPGGHVLRGREQGHALLLVGGRVAAAVHARGPDPPLLRDAQLLGHPAEARPHQLRRLRSPARPHLRRRPAGHAGDGAVRVWAQPGHPAPAKVPDQGRQRGRQPGAACRALKSTIVLELP
jgi:hypothetical protein